MTTFPTLPIPSNGGGDTLEYAVYPVDPSTNLSNILHYTLDLVTTLTDNYIWNHDPFTLTLDTSGHALRGALDLGSVSGVMLDEWIIVYIFWQDSKRFDNVVINIQDSDGEFMLIESALHIPTWLKPETAENRVFPRE